jgi:hypothetical protein
MSFLTPGKENSIQFAHEADWAPQAVCKVLKKTKYFLSPQNGDFSFLQPVV